MFEGTQKFVFVFENRCQLKGSLKLSKLISFSMSRCRSDNLFEGI
jgi:hypothetical protein